MPSNSCDEWVKGCARHWNKGFRVHTIVSSDWGEGSVGKQLSVEELTLDP